MDGRTYASYFLQPGALAHTRYETLRAECVDERPLGEAVLRHPTNTLTFDSYGDLVVATKRRRRWPAQPI